MSAVPPIAPPEPPVALWVPLASGHSSEEQTRSRQLSASEEATLAVLARTPAALVGVDERGRRRSVRLSVDEIVDGAISELLATRVQC